MVTLRDNKDYIWVLLYSCYTSIAGWGGPPKGCDMLKARLHISDCLLNGPRNLTQGSDVHQPWHDTYMGIRSRRENILKYSGLSSVKTRTLKRQLCHPRVSCICL